MKKEKNLLMNRKGFTLIEIIGVVVILGIIAIIAVPYFIRSMNTFREDYYSNVVKNIETSGKEFFQDNSKYLPSKYLNSSKVTLNTLISQNYMDEISDYEGNNCNSDSYVIVIRRARDEYSYTVCMKCPDDNYDNTNEKECDKAWEDNSEGTILVGLGEPENKYIYKDSTREKVIEKLKISGTVIKKNYADEVIGEVSGEGEEDIPVILPSNIDTIDTSKVGSYNTEYEYEGTRQEGVAIVYENSEPNITMQKENIVRRNTVTTNTTKEVTAYNGEGEWGQKVIISFTTSEEDNRVYKESGTSVSKYQWKRGERWLDFCTADGSNNCTREIEEEMNEVVYFRSIDNEGNISRESKGYIIRIDNTKPTCTLTTSGTMGDNDWYTSDVTVSFEEAKDVSKTSDESISDIKTKGITLSAIGTSETEIQSTDTTSVTWYGYIEDNAENSNLCQVIVKKDTVAPTCELAASGTSGTNGWFISNVTVKFNKTIDATSGVSEYGMSSYTGERTATLSTDTNTSGNVYTGYIKDNAGNTNTCSLNVKRDTAAPTNLTLSGCGNTSTSSIKVSIYASDSNGVAYFESTTNKSTTSSITSNLNTGIQYIGSVSYSSNGTYSNYYRAVDLAGNVSGWSDVCTVKKTQPAPSCSRVRECGCEKYHYCHYKYGDCNSSKTSYYSYTVCKTYECC